MRIDLPSVEGDHLSNAVCLDQVGHNNWVGMLLYFVVALLGPLSVHDDHALAVWLEDFGFTIHL